MGDAFQGDFVAHQPIVGPDLAREINVLAAQRAPATSDAAKHQVKADQLPDGIHAETARLDGIVAEVAPEIPGIHNNVLFGRDQPAGAVMLNVDDAVEHQQGRAGQTSHFRRGIVDEGSIAVCNELFLSEGALLLEFEMGHISVTRFREAGPRQPRGGRQPRRLAYSDWRVMTIRAQLLYKWGHYRGTTYS